MIKVCVTTRAAIWLAKEKFVIADDGMFHLEFDTKEEAEETCNLIDDVIPFSDWFVCTIPYFAIERKGD